jgi:hypothetical protein
MQFFKELFSLKEVNKAKQRSMTQVLTTNTVSEFPSLDLVTDLVWDLVKSQPGRANALDSKASFVLSAATTLIAAALVLFPPILTSHSACSTVMPLLVRALPALVKRAVLVLPLLIMYGLVMFFAYQAYKIRRYVEVPLPRPLLDRYVDKPEEYTKAIVIQSMVDAYEENEDEITNKADYVYRALIFLMLEALVFVLLLLFRVLC